MVLNTHTHTLSLSLSSSISCCQHIHLSVHSIHYLLTFETISLSSKFISHSLYLTLSLPFLLIYLLINLCTICLPCTLPFSLSLHVYILYISFALYYYNSLSLHLFMVFCISLSLLYLTSSIIHAVYTSHLSLARKHIHLSLHCFIRLSILLIYRRIFSWHQIQSSIAETYRRQSEAVGKKRSFMRRHSPPQNHQSNVRITSPPEENDRHPNLNSSTEDSSPDLPEKRSRRANPEDSSSSGSREELTWRNNSARSRDRHGQKSTRIARIVDFLRDSQKNDEVGINHLSSSYFLSSYCCMAGR